MSTRRLPPLESGATASLPVRFARLTWLELRRLLRGWRWRGLAVLVIPATALLSRGEMFGYAASVFYPGGELGALVSAGVFALAGVVFGVDAWGGADRHRAARLLESKLVHPAEVLLSRIAAAFVGLTALALLSALWPVIGAWRADYPVLWGPPFIFVACILAPLILAGTAGGFLARVLSSGDTGGMGIGMLFAAPAVWFRLFVADPLDVFQRVSLQLGSLVPTDQLVRDFVLTFGWGIALAGLTILCVPRRRPSTALASGKLDRLSRIAWTKGRVQTIVGRIRQVPAGSLVAAVILIAVGAPAMVALSEERPFPSARIDWTRMVEPPGLTRGLLPPASIESRSVRISAEANGGVTMELGLRSSTNGNQNSFALTFGPALVPSEFTSDRRKLEWLQNSTSPESQLYLLTIDPPLTPDATTTISVTLDVAEHAMRRWRRGYADNYRSFAEVPSWWGESAVIDFVDNRAVVIRQRARLVAELPRLDGLTWINRGVSAVREADRDMLVSRLPTVPSSLQAATLHRQEDTTGSLSLSWLAFPERRRLLQNFPTIYRNPLARIERAFGPQDTPLVFYEVPTQASDDLMAMPSPVLDRLTYALPRYRDWDFPSDAEFDSAFIRWNRGLISEIVLRSWDEFEDRQLLADSLIEYLDEYALLRGQSRDVQRSARLDSILVPWGIARDRMTPMSTSTSEDDFRGQRRRWREYVAKQDFYPFDLRESETPGYLGPATIARPPSLPEVPQKRHLAFHHMLRGLLGEEAYVAMLQDVYGKPHGGRLTIAGFQAAAERAHGSPLGSFFDQWLTVGVLPKLRVLEVQCTLIENPETRTVEYRTRILVANRGTGTVAVPWLLQTETDPVSGTVLLGEGETSEFNVVTIARPTDFSLDPFGWILQLPEFDPMAKRPIHPRVFIKAIAEA